MEGGETFVSVPDLNLFLNIVKTPSGMCYVGGNRMEGKGCMIPCSKRIKI